MIRIFHISDLHLESETPSFEKRAIIKSLANDIKTFSNENSILVFTGDLLDKGAKIFQTKEKAFNYFEELFIDVILNLNPTLKGKCFIVPGNHDVFRDKIDPVTESGLKASLRDTASLDSFIENNRLTSKHLDRLMDYKSWEKEFYLKNNGVQSTNFENSFELIIDNRKIGITCLNSSWMCKDANDKENILLGRNQIEKSLIAIEQCHIKIAILHHPMEFIKEFDRNISKNELYKNYDIIFTGHVHELASSYTQDLFGNIFISIANSTLGDFPTERKYVNGYTIIGRGLTAFNRYLCAWS